jgi:hypothetical protein
MTTCGRSAAFRVEGPTAPVLVLELGRPSVAQATQRQKLPDAQPRTVLDVGPHFGHGYGVSQVVSHGRPSVPPDSIMIKV